jgi:hypothetical protein
MLDNPLWYIQHGRDIAIGCFITAGTALITFYWLTRR